MNPIRPAITLLLLAGGCASLSHDTSPSIVTTLYFGLSQPDGTQVTDAQWQAFVDNDLARLFPSGFTILAGDGGWQEHGKTIHEPSRVVILVRRDSPAVDGAIEQLRALYCKRFNQESVLRVDQEAEHVAF